MIGPDVGGAFASPASIQRVQYENTHLQPGAPDSGEYLSGDMPDYQHGGVISGAGASPGETPMNINGVANPMDPSPGIM